MSGQRSVRAICYEIRRGLLPEAGYTDAWEGEGAKRSRSHLILASLRQSGGVVSGTNAKFNGTN